MHKFKIGDRVRLTELQERYFTASGEFEIIRLLPPADNEPAYRIKGAHESHERLVRESEILPVGEHSLAATAGTD